MTLTTVTKAGSTACRPRFATPRDESFPTLGSQVGEIARRLGLPPMRWQQDLFDVAYEYDPITGLFRYGEVDTTVPRQSGKTTVTLAKKVHRLTKLAREYGPQRATYTAQTRLAARKKLERDFAEKLRGSRSFSEVPHSRAKPTRQTAWKLSLNNGSEAIQFGSPGSFLQIDAPSRTGGHGDTLDDGTIDEAFAHRDDTVEMSMVPAMATRRNAQLWVFSTAGDAESFYLWRKVLAGREASVAGEHGRVCYVEYSADDDADPGDPQTWWSCMPALGVTITEDFIRSEWDRAQRKGADGIDAFRRAYLNQWPQVPDLSSDKGAAVFKGRWPDLADAAAERGSPVTFGVAVAPDREWAAVAVAWTRPDGFVQVMLADYRPTTDWLAARVADLRTAWGGRVLASTAARGLVANAVEPSQSDQALAHTGLDDAVTAGTVRHGNENALNTAVRCAKWRTFGDTRMLDRKGAADISPLDAAALAHYGQVTGPSREFFGTLA